MSFAQLHVVVDCFFRMVQLYFFKNKLLKLTCTKTIELKVEVERSNWLLLHRLFGLTMKLLKERVSKGFFDRDAVVWVVSQHFPDEVDGERVGALEKLVKVLAFSFG